MPTIADANWPAESGLPGRAWPAYAGTCLLSLGNRQAHTVAMAEVSLVSVITCKRTKAGVVSKLAADDLV